MLDTARIASLSVSDLSQEQNRQVDEGNLTAAEELIRTWLTVNKRGDPIIPRIELARILFWQGKPVEAKNYLEVALKDCPNNTWVLSFLGQVEARLGNYTQAENLFREALAYYEHNHEALTFLDSNVMDQLLNAKQLLTHRKISFRDALRVAELYSAIDFKHGKKLDFETGPITQESFDRFNIMLDIAEVGNEVDSQTTLREQFNRAEEIILFTSHAFGDALLGVALLQIIDRYFELNRMKTKPVEIITPFVDVFEGLAEAYPYVRVKKVCGVKNINLVLLCADYLESKTKPVFAFVGADHEIYTPLAQIRKNKENILALVDAFVGRVSLDIRPWQSIFAPYHRITSLPARLTRFFEMVVGQKLVDKPTEVKVTLPLSHRMIERRAELLRKYKLQPLNYHVIVESASMKAKEISHEQYPEILAGLARQVELEEQESKETLCKIVFSKDPFIEDSFAEKISSLPKGILKRMVVICEDLISLAALLSEAKTVLSADTGIAHMAGTLDIETLIIYTMADPYLWNSGGKNIEILASRRAKDAHYNATAVNMIEWSLDSRITHEEFTADEIVDAWRRVAKRASAKKAKDKPLSKVMPAARTHQSQPSSFLSYFDRTYYKNLGVRRDSFRKIFELLESQKKSFYTIIETGVANLCINNSLTSPEAFSHQGQSTILFDEFLNHCDGMLYSVDVNPTHCALARNVVSPKTCVTCADSVAFLWGFESVYNIDCIYMDSYDIDWDDPHPSSLHHLKEFCAILPKLRPGCIVFVDDNNGSSGKGGYIRDFMKQVGVDTIFDNYQVGWVIMPNGKFPQRH